MAGDKRLAEDLASLAADDRQRLDEPPTLEQLAALGDGELPEDEADRLRARLAVDPESADLYLELKRFVEAAAETTAGLDTTQDVDQAWQELSQTLERPPSEPEEEDAYQVVPFHRRPTVRAVLGLAAVLIVAVGLGQWARQTSPQGDYYRLDVTGDVFRDVRERIPAGYEGLEFRIDLSGKSGRWVVELLDAKDRPVRSAETFDAGQGKVVYRVARRDLVDGATYQLHVRSVDEPESRPVMIIQPEFVE